MTRENYGNSSSTGEVTWFSLLQPVREWLTPSSTTSLALVRFLLPSVNNRIEQATELEPYIFFVVWHDFNVSKIVVGRAVEGLEEWLTRLKRLRRVSNFRRVRWSGQLLLWLWYIEGVVLKSRVEWNLRHVPVQVLTLWQLYSSIEPALWVWRSKGQGQVQGLSRLMLLFIERNGILRRSRALSEAVGTLEHQLM